MTEMQTHEDLMEAGKLCEFDEEMGNAMFVSHQWVTSEHPDPEMEQLGVLQQALQNLLAGRSQVSRTPAEELWWKRVRCPSMSDFNAKALYLWYDYFSCPQGTSPEATLNRQLAIDCIPSYVARLAPRIKSVVKTGTSWIPENFLVLSEWLGPCPRSFFFAILCPFVHGVDGRSLNYSTWEARGWCRLEYMARQLAREDGSIICIKTPHHQALAVDLNGVPKAAVFWCLKLRHSPEKNHRPLKIMATNSMKLTIQLSHLSGGQTVGFQEGIPIQRQSMGCLGSYPLNEI